MKIEIIAGLIRESLEGVLHYRLESLTVEGEITARIVAEVNGREEEITGTGMEYNEVVSDILGKYITYAAA